MSDSLRHARSADTARLSQLQSVLAEPAPALLSAALADRPAMSNPSSTRTFRLLVSVDDDDQPVGYLLALTAGSTHLAELVVHPDFRREGRARTLLATVIASSTPPITVHVAADNDAARTLYASCGFVENERTANQFETGDGLTLRYKNG